ncbi:MAG: NADP-dependent phosphogluconate dehydrogenase [Bacteroidetes bacterium]|nr:NADP-dependent phosphogluconate dehydrogenase [Bacteroidota bacterium]MBS1973930.1 NADP-dependent phosphogluconate dehydrogenase [Bacteroidota bacterium]
MANNLFDFGMVGLGVMGRNLLLNMADHGFKAIGFDKDETKGKLLESSATPGTTVKGVSTLAEMIRALQPPRKLMMLVPAGKPVDDVIRDLLPLLQKGDIIIDGGNSHYTDTLKRIDYLKDTGIHFMGVGVSGGEHGARTGPSIMPGGDAEAYKNVAPVLEAVAAKASGSACVAYMGKNAAGHYVKMVHNGIEYAIMQLISEVYDLLKNGLGLNNDELHKVFKTWNEGEQQSFLIEITRDIFLQKDDKTNNRLVDMILDKAGAKGTGKWTSQDAMDLGIPIGVIDTAVSLRSLSACKDERTQAAALYKTVVHPIEVPKEIFIQQAGDALFFATIICYAQGLSLLHKASSELQMEISLPEVVRIWRGGCIIRSVLLETFYKAYTLSPELPNLLLNAEVAQLLQKKLLHTRTVILHATQAGYPIAGLMSALSYFEGYRTGKLPTNLIQAQRDYFGAHTYQRIDMQGTFHTEWQAH